MPAKLHAATRRELLLGSGALFAWAFVPKIARAEGRDPRAALAFVGRPASPTNVAAAILGLIRRPRRELVTPSLHRFVGGIVTAFPGMFGFLFPHLQRLGDRRLQVHVPCCLRGQEVKCGFLS